MEFLLVLVGCAILLGLIALYFRFTDAELIDEEAEEEVEAESAEEHARARLERQHRLLEAQQEEQADQFIDGQ